MYAHPLTLAVVFPVVVALAVESAGSPADGVDPAAAAVEYDAAFEAAARRGDFKRAVVYQLVDGRTSLTTAAHSVWDVFQTDRAYNVAIAYMPGDTPEARTASNLIDQAESAMAGSPDAPRVLERLAAEYRAAYGAPSPAAGVEH